MTCESRKGWSYQEITKKAEDRIAQLMEASRREQDSEARRLGRMMAFGAYLGWYDLVAGWMDPGDAERLEALTKE